MKIAVVIPSYKVKNHILEVIRGIPHYVQNIIVVDDACPEGTGEFVRENTNDKRVTIIKHSLNQGVGGATQTGYRAALEMSAEIIVKMDGDGQMNPAELSKLISPIIAGSVGYAKGNRFADSRVVLKMPKIRIFGNLILSFLSKASSGYWTIFDPNNGYTAIQRNALQKIPLERVDSRYFFESDMLFRLNLANIAIADVEMQPIYADEQSNLSPLKVAPEFFIKHSRNFLKRLIYVYYVRDFNIASIELPIGMTFLSVGIFRGLLSWRKAIATNLPTPTGTIVLIAVFILAGLQLVLSFLNYDINNYPKDSHPNLLRNHKDYDSK